MDEASERLQRLVRSVAENPRHIRALIRADRLMVALILNKPELFPDGEFTILQAVEHLGDELVRTAIEVEKATARDMED